MNELIAIIEDEPDLLELLEYNLKKVGYDVEGFLSTDNVEKLLKTEPVELMIVDRNLPCVEGSEFVAALRQKGFTIPVIFLTAKVEESHKIEGFARGGDDYITKPFSIQELLARINAILRRTRPISDKIQYRDIVIEMERQQVFIDGAEISLTKKEFDLLVYMLKNRNIVMTRETLLEEVWGDEIYQDRTVDVAIKRLKEKIDPSRTKEYIQSIRGVGYKLC